MLLDNNVDNTNAHVRSSGIGVDTQLFFTDPFETPLLHESSLWVDTLEKHLDSFIVDLTTDDALPLKMDSESVLGSFNLRSHLNRQTSESSLSDNTLGLDALAELTREIIFIDAGVDHSQQLASAVTDDAEIFILNSEEDGIQQISEILSQYQNISGISIVSHGGSGSLKVGSTYLTSGTLSHYGEMLQQWGDSLTTDADIFLYGCNVAAGEEGKTFVEQLSNLTDADVAASIDLTGAEQLGGNWHLEFMTGAVEAAPFQTSSLTTYDSLLPISTFIDDGVKLDVTEVGGTWIQGDGYLEQTGTNKFLYADEVIPGGDFTITASLSLAELNGTAATFEIDGNRFGFEGVSGQFFTAGEDWGSVHKFGTPSDFIDPGQPFTFEVSREGSEIVFAIDGADIHTELLTSGTLTNVGFRPWRNTMRIYDFYLETSDQSINTQPTISSNGGENSANLTVPEEQSMVTVVQANDPDPGDTLTYSISGGADAALFKVDDASGQLSFDSPPDFENPIDTNGDNVYVVEVQATDASGDFDRQLLNIAISDINESVFQRFINDGSRLDVVEVGGAWIQGDGYLEQTGTNKFLYADEIIPAGDFTITAFLSLAELNGTAATFEIDGNRFGFEGASGQFFTTGEEWGSVHKFGNPSDFIDPGQPFTFEVSREGSEISFAIDGTNIHTELLTSGTLTDVGFRPWRNTMRLFDFYIETNVAPNIVSDGGGDVANLSVSEEQSAATLVQADDLNIRDTLTYSIGGGVDASLFNINADTGELFFNALPDFENPIDSDGDNVYEVEVRVTDNSGESDSQELNISITDINDETSNNPPSIISNGGSDIANLSSFEEQVDVFTVQASDPDVGDRLTYSISNGADASLFNIDAQTGELQFISAPDFENPADIDVNNLYEVEIQVTDLEGALDKQLLLIEVLDVNEETNLPPSITSNGGMDVVSLNTLEEQLDITIVQATDPDPGDTLTYSISGGIDALRFNINAQTGELRFNTTPDFENPEDSDSNNVYEVEVQATDSSGAFDRQVLDISVTDIQEFISQSFVDDGAKINVLEVGGSWSQGNGYIEQSGINTFLYADEIIPAGDFTITAKLSLEELNGTAASFEIDGNQFGFEGASGQFFTSGEEWGTVQKFGNPDEFIDPGQPFTFEVDREGSTIFFAINGTLIHQESLDSDALTDVGFRPWRNTMRIFDFTLQEFNGVPVPGSFVESQVFRSNTNGYSSFRIPAIVQAGNSDLLAFSEGRVNNRNDFGNIDIVMRRSSDGGVTWQPLNVIVDNGDLKAGNVSVVLNTQNADQLVMVYNTATHSEPVLESGTGVQEVWVITSDDHGNTWSEPVNITTSVHKPNEPTFNSNYNFSEDWRLVAVQPGQGIQLENGRLIFGANFKLADKKSRAFSFHSDDNGQTWELGGIAGFPGNENQITQLSDGRLLMNARPHKFHNELYRQISYSDDNGETWTPFMSDLELPDPRVHGSIISFNPDGTHRVLFSNPASQIARENLVVRLSYDDGESWAYSRTIQPGFAAYSDLVFQADNDIGILYESDGYNLITYANFDLAWLTDGQDVLA